ncbi:MAG: hypothetical protein L0229_12300 [Blastocatellia bacterium]|nr:hypothetical protein [Blastocatellia bacterium]
MITSLLDIEDARARLTSGDQPYAFEMSDQTTVLGPACGFGADYLRHLQTEGRYAESFETAEQIADLRGAIITEYGL